jgi:NMT1/THI5 like
MGKCQQILYTGLFPAKEEKRGPMFRVAKAVHRIAAGALIASMILLRPNASNALDNITLITDFGYNGRHAYFFDAVDKGYYRDAGLEVKIVRGQGSMDAIRQVGAGNAMFGFADASSLILARANDQIPVKLVAIVYSKPPQAIFCREDSGLKKPKDLEGNAIAAAAGSAIRALLLAVISGLRQSRRHRCSDGAVGRHEQRVIARPSCRQQVPLYRRDHSCRSVIAVSTRGRQTHTFRLFRCFKLLRPRHRGDRCDDREQA